MAGKFVSVTAAGLLAAQASLVLSTPMQEGTEFPLVGVTTSNLVHSGELANVYLNWYENPRGRVKAVYAPCDFHDAFPEGQEIGSFTAKEQLPEHLAWAVLEDAQNNGCIQIFRFDDGTGSVQLLGKSTDNHPLLKDFESLGAWFHGVTSIKDKVNCDGAVVSGQKNTSIAIIGGGISGLATALMLDSVRLHNWEIIEASDHVGGRFRTKFVGGTKEWSEMGPMRLPYSVTYKDNNEMLEYTDHRMLFQLADLLNEMNYNDPKWKINFIPWIQHHPNKLLGLGTDRLPDGRIPTRAADPSLDKPTPMTSKEYNDTKSRMEDILEHEETLKSL